MDLTVRFPYTSARGNQYILIIYDYDSNCILATATKTRQAGELTQAFTDLHATLSNRGAAPNVYILDNEFSLEMKQAMKKYTLQYQLVPLHQHCRNAAEHAIQKFKNHFLAGLSSTNPNFPINQWDRLLPQAVITLNLLRN